MEADRKISVACIAIRIWLHFFNLLWSMILSSNKKKANSTLKSLLIVSTISYSIQICSTLFSIFNQLKIVNKKTLRSLKITVISSCETAANTHYMLHHFQGNKPVVYFVLFQQNPYFRIHFLYQIGLSVRQTVCSSECLPTTAKRCATLPSNSVISPATFFRLVANQWLISVLLHCFPLISLCPAAIIDHRFFHQALCQIRIVNMTCLEQTASKRTEASPGVEPL